jgi:hypothetical protein
VVSVAGYHLHFINDLKTHGGHSLDFTLGHGEISVRTASELHLSLPRTDAFREANMSIGNLTEQIRQTEGGLPRDRAGQPANLTCPPARPSSPSLMMREQGAVVSGRGLVSGVLGHL